MCIRVIETCPGCECKTGHVDTRRLPTCSPSCNNVVREVEQPATRARLPTIVCRSEGCNFSQAAMDAVDARAQSLGAHPAGEPTLVVGPTGTARRERERLERLYGLFTERTELPPCNSVAVGPSKIAGPSLSGGSAVRTGKVPPNMQKITFQQPTLGGRVKTQFRSIGFLRMEDLDPDVVQSIRTEKAEMDRQIAAQAAALDLRHVPGTGFLPPEWVVAEDNLLQHLRRRGFSFAQIHRDFMPQRSIAALTIRRKKHSSKARPGFVYHEEGEVVDGEEEQPDQ